MLATFYPPNPSLISSSFSCRAHDSYLNLSIFPKSSVNGVSCRPVHKELSLGNLIALFCLFIFSFISVGTWIKQINLIVLKGVLGYETGLDYIHVFPGFLITSVVMELGSSVSVVYARSGGIWFKIWINGDPIISCFLLLLIKICCNCIWVPLLLLNCNCWIVFQCLTHSTVFVDTLCVCVFFL